MKIIITSQGEDLISQVDPRFGRAKYFVIYNTETEEIIMKSNEQNLNAAQGAGIQSAQNVVDFGGEMVMTGHCGPKAFRILNEGGIKVVTDVSGTVADAIELYKKGNINFAQSADVEGHWM